MDGEYAKHILFYNGGRLMCLLYRYPDLNTFIRERWEARYLQYWDANDMIALLNTWQNGDISKVRDDGNYEKALRDIKAKVLLMPSRTDLYFPVCE